MVYPFRASSLFFVGCTCPRLQLVVASTIHTHTFKLRHHKNKDAQGGSEVPAHGRERAHTHKRQPGKNHWLMKMCALGLQILLVTFEHRNSFWPNLSGR